MRFKKIKEDEPNISIAPLIDIVFLLLIFFMVTSHFDIASGVRINLPNATKRLLGEDESNRVTLIIDRSARTFIEGKQLDNKSLQQRLGELINKNGLFDLVLQADKDVSHGKVVRIMDLAKSAGVQSIIIAVQWKPEDLE